jgi:hypothetical protein
MTQMQLVALTLVAAALIAATVAYGILRLYAA